MSDPPFFRPIVSDGIRPVLDELAKLCDDGVQTRFRMHRILCGLFGYFPTQVPPAVDQAFDEFINRDHPDRLARLVEALEAERRARFGLKE